jgi:TonB family protein
MAHVALTWIVARAPVISPLPQRPTTPLVMIPVDPTARPTNSLSGLPRPLSVGPIVIEQPSLRLLEEGNVAGVFAEKRVGMTPPRPLNAENDMTAFARAAGLQSGTGAIVVLRVEVLGSGDVGRVEIEVSGGSRQIDEAAIAYVRSLKWVGGQVDEQPTTLWIRWGVRLDG